MLGLALISDTPDLWHGAGIVWAARLTMPERMALAFTALSALDPDTREQVFQAAQRGAVA